MLRLAATLEEMNLKSTVVGPYPRVGSKRGDALRKELNKAYEGTGDAQLVQSLRKDLTREIIQEMVTAGIDLPNCGLVEVHDELTWPLENVDGVQFGGMKKVFHTNTHYREAIVTNRISRKRRLLSDLYEVASEVHPTIKVEFPGPCTMAKHSLLGKGSPYRNLRELAEAYASLYREELAELKGTPLVQFNEPSVVAPRATSEDVEMLSELYSKMLRGVNIPVAVWTYYGKYSSRLLDALFSLPVDVVGLDFVWDPQVATLLEKKPCDKGIGIGLIDSGDQGLIRMEDSKKVGGALSMLKSHVNFEKSFLSSNATLEHLPRDHARRKLALIGEEVRRMNR